MGFLLAFFSLVSQYRIHRQMPQMASMVTRGMAMGSKHQQLLVIPSYRLKTTVEGRRRSEISLEHLRDGKGKSQ